MSVPLSCPVRGCGQPLARDPTRWVCAGAHAFDVARSGYVNFLQPQDRRSAHPGDTAAAVAARSRLLASGVGGGLYQSVAEAAEALTLRKRPVVVDLGCGGGEFLGRFLRPRPGATARVGIDISTAAISAAARAFKGVTWIVANADRRLPLPDASVDLVVSIHARRNPAECARVLIPGGHLVLTIPAADDLIELREAVLGQRLEQERIEGVVTEHSSAFTLISRVDCREQSLLQPAQLQDLLSGTYRGVRFAAGPRRAGLGAMPVTLASNVLVFRPRA